MEQSKSNKLTGALAWKLLERFGVQGVQFVLQIILARILSPDHYGVLSIMLIFVNLANVFVQSNINSFGISKSIHKEHYISHFDFFLGNHCLFKVVYYSLSLS